MSEEKLLGTEETVWPANGLDTEDVQRVAMALMTEAAPTLGSPHTKERWGAYADVPTRLSVQVPLAELSLQDLLALKPGMLLRTEWQISQDVSLLVGDVFLAFVSCEPAGDRLGVRINGFDRAAGAL